MIASSVENVLMKRVSTCRMSVSPTQKTQLEPRGDAEYGPMYRDIVIIERKTAAFRVVRVKRLVAEHCAPSSGIRPANFVLQKPKRLPRELTPDVKPAHIAAQDKLPGGSKLVAQARANQWIEPADAFCCREEAFLGQGEVKNIERAGYR